MSKLAQKIAAADPSKATPPSKRGPDNACFPLYGAGDLEDWEALEQKRRRGAPDGGPLEWAAVQAIVDEHVGVSKPLPLTKFKWHWRRRCYCWPPDLRLG